MKNEDLSFYDQIKDLCYIRKSMPEVITRREFLDGKEHHLIFDDLQKKFYKLKGNAGKIWEMLDGEASVATMVHRLQDETGSEQDVIVRDICKFIHKIGKNGLIRAAIQKVQKSERDENPSACASIC